MANANFRVKHGLEVTGSVGIGTTNPTAKLDVNGTLNVSGVSTFVDGMTLGENQSFDFGSTNRRITSTGSTLELKTSGVNDVKLAANDDGSTHGNVEIRTGAVGGKVYLTGTGGVGIYHTDTAKKLETVGTGISVHGNIDLLASDMSTGISTISGPATIHIDPSPAGVGETSGSVRIKGDLYVDGTNFVVDSETITLADHVVGIASTATTDALTDGAGIGIGSDKTFTYDNTNTSLKSSENLNLASGKTYKIDGSDVLSETTLGSGVTASSLTSVGTLTELNIYKPTSTTGVTTHLKVQDGNIYWAVEFEGNANTNTRIPYITSNKGLYFSSDGDFNFSNYAGTENYIQWTSSAGQLDLLYGNSSQGHTNAIKLSTKTYGIDVTGRIETDTLNVSGVSTFQNNVHLLDSDKLLLGGSAGTHDGLEVYHDSNHSYVNDTGTGNLYIGGNKIWISDANTATASAVFNPTTYSALYYNGSEKFKTTGGGVEVTGILTATSIDASVSYASNAGIATTATNATNITIAATPSDTYVYPVFVATSNEGNQAPFIDSAISYDTDNDTLRVSVIHPYYGIDLDDNDYIHFGSQNDVKVFYDGTANDLEIELESAANGIAITDNGTYKHKITKTSVGINTATPREEMDVIGDIGVQASGASNRFSIQHNSAQNSLDFVFI